MATGRSPTAVVCGAGGFIGHHLVHRLKEDGYRVRGVDQKYPEWSSSPADEFVLADLRDPSTTSDVLDIEGGTDEVYQLAADMGGMGFIHSAEAEIMRNSVLVSAHAVEAAGRIGVKRYFYASSVCVYRDMEVGEDELSEEDAYPAQPDNEYGWEKLYTERMVSAFGARYGFDVRIGRFQNCYGPEGTWDGGREKAPAALSRKVAQSTDGTIEVWGDGSAVRNFVYVTDLVRAVRLLVESDRSEPTNIGTREYVTVKDLVGLVAEVAGKEISPVWVPGEVGVQSRNFSNDRIEQLGFRPEFDLRAGLAETYPWIAGQVNASQ
jgi:nucleoside-diphosphate-sugar epimerase